MSKKIVVIGGSAAGPKAAARARRLDETAEITMIQKGADLSMASCGYPYYVGGVFDDRKKLLCTPTGTVRDPNFFMNVKKVEALTQTEALSIDRKNKTVHVKNLISGEEKDVAYDSLILATGSIAGRPPVPGADLEGITTLQSMEDADFLRQVHDEKKVSSAVVIGGGLIGIETCEALQLAGIQTNLVEMMDQILPFLDWEMAKLVQNHIEAKGTKVFLENGLAEFIGENGKLTAVRLKDGTEIPCGVALLATGVRPNVELAKAAGLEIGETGSILVDDYMGTSDPDIFAAGDCIEVTNSITGKKVHAPYGDLANLEGRVAGENALLGKKVTFTGVVQTGICKIFDFSAGITGLSEKNAIKNGFDDALIITNASPDKPGFMGGMLLVTKLIADKKTKKILGAQCIGPGDVSKQIAIWATAIKGKLTYEDMINADLPYAPPFSLALDHSIASAHIMQNKARGLFKGLTACEVKAKLDAGEKPFMLDVRGLDEFEEMRLGVGEKLIPLGALRKRIDEVDVPKDAEIICYCKISLRGYEAALILQANGWTNVSIMEGGIMSWPFKREK